MSVPKRVSIVTLGVADLPRSTAFYRALGWQPTAYSEESITFFDTAGSMLALFSQADLATDAGVAPRTGDGFRGVPLAINCTSDAEVEQTLAAAQAAGAMITKPAARSPFFAGLDGYFADLDGHLWEVAHNPDLLPG